MWFSPYLGIRSRGGGGGGGAPRGLVHNLLTQKSTLLNAIVIMRTRGPWRVMDSHTPCVAP